MKEVKIITTDDLHTDILDYIKRNEIIIGEYEDMKECILKMIRAYYIFNMDRDRLRDAMEDITYMLCPEDDINKDRVSRGLEYEYSSEEEEEEEEYLEQRGEECGQGNCCVNKEEYLKQRGEECGQGNCCVNKEEEEEEEEVEDIGDIVSGQIEKRLQNLIEKSD